MVRTHSADGSITAAFVASVAQRIAEALGKDWDRLPEQPDKSDFMTAAETVIEMVRKSMS